jgi:carbonic anhydrase/acetyltransferase-like protein (isoleucine patch superfamily)
VAFTLQELAALSGGKLSGDPKQIVTGAASLADAIPGEISFFSDPRYIHLLRKTHASAVFVPASFSEKIDAAQIRVANPAKAFEQVALKLAPKPVTIAAGIHPTAVVDPTAKLEANVCVQPYAVIEAGTRVGAGTIIGAGTYVGQECVIGADTMIYPNVTIRERIIIGSRVVIHSGAVIGADGFGFEMIDGKAISDCPARIPSSVVNEQRHEARVEVEAGSHAVDVVFAERGEDFVAVLLVQLLWVVELVAVDEVAQAVDRAAHALGRLLARPLRLVAARDEARHHRPEGPDPE